MNHKQFLTLCAVLLLTNLGLIGCKPTNYPPNERPTLYTTISSDGQMVAALDRIGTDKPRLRVMRLEPEGPWQDMPVPPYTTSIRFGLKGHELLLTNHIGENEKSDLSKWDMDAPDKGPQRIYRADGLVFPIEVSAGQYLVRACPLTPENKCHPWFNVWHLVAQDKLIHAYTEERRLNYSWPNVVQGQGFFWMRVREEQEKNELPAIRSVAFPSKTAPTFNIEKLMKNSSNLVCDYKTERCLRNFIRDRLNPTGYEPYVYDVEVLYRAKSCQPLGLNGYYDKESLTPDGNAAVMSLAPGYDQPRHVVVMQFKPGQCEPTSTQHIYFNSGDKK